MAGETLKSEAVCLSISPWSKTSHVVNWLTPEGGVATVVKGAVRPKSFFLGQYDLNYTCEILYYARAKGEVHALRECVAIARRDFLRDDWRAAMLAGYFRHMVGELAPMGPDCREMYDLLAQSLDDLKRECGVNALLRFELRLLDLLGLKPEIAENGGEIELRGERKMQVSSEVARFIAEPSDEKKLKILLDAARVISVYYAFHVGVGTEIRRSILAMLSKNKE